LAVFCATAQAIDPAQLKKHTIDDGFENGYQVSVVDIDKDGKPDVIALATSPSKLVWYRNPDWKQFTITTKTRRNIDVAPYDIDGDGDQDFALASGFSLDASNSEGHVDWLECPANPAEEQEWAAHRIDAVPTSHRVRWADVDGDGRKELLNLPIVGTAAKLPGYEGRLDFWSYTIPSNPLTGKWKGVVLSDSLELAHALAVVDWTPGGAQEVLTASGAGVMLLEPRIKDGKNAERIIGTGHEGAPAKRGSSEVALGALASQESRYVAAIEPWHGNEVVVYESEEPNSLPWTRTVVDSSLTDGHALLCVDLDKDGNDEIVAGYRGGDRSIRVYQFAAESAEWEIAVLDPSGIGAAGLFAADINSDGYVDIVAIGTATNNVVWYENLYGRED